MRLNLILKILIILAMAVFFSACETVFLNPLSDLRDSKSDKRLLGKWSIKGEKYNGAYLQFDGGSNLKHNLFAVFGGDTQEQNLVFTMFTTRIGKYSYMNLNPADKDKDKGYLIVRYAVDGNQLTVWILDTDKIKTAIKSGKLKGTPGQSFGTTTVSDTPANIEAFLGSPDNGDLFQDAWRFEKVESK